MKGIKPLGNRVLVKRASAKTTKGGIILPESAQEKPKLAEVISVGQGKHDEDGKLHPMEVKIGDQVLYSNYAGTEVKGDEQDVEYLILSEDDILAVLS